MIIWIETYPESGNTYVRSLLSAYYFSKDGEFSFNLLKNKEKNEGFKEAAYSKEEEKIKVFFNLGFNNRWKKLLTEKIRKKIENEFTEEMNELGYL